MDSHFALLVLLFTFKTSNSVRIVFEVENAYFNENPIKLQAVDGSGHVVGEEEELRYRKSLNWEVAMDSYEETLTYLCHVSVLEKSGGDETYVGFFEVFNAAWLKDSFRSLRPDQRITVLWFVFEKGATTKLDGEMGGQKRSHRWLLLKFDVVNDFDERVELCALEEYGSTVKEGIVPKGETLHWSRFVTGTKHFKYNLKASKFITRKRTQEIGTVDIFNSESIDRQVLEEIGTLESWRAVNNSGIHKYNPITGKYSKKKISWPSNNDLRTRSFDEAQSAAEDGRRKKRSKTN